MTPARTTTVPSGGENDSALAMMFWKTAGLGVLYTIVYLLVGYFIFAGKEL